MLVDEFKLFGEIDECGAGAEFMDEDFFGDGLSVFGGDNTFGAAKVFC